MVRRSQGWDVRRVPVPSHPPSSASAQPSVYVATAAASGEGAQRLRPNALGLA